jgi:hypothetical protein
MTNPIVRELFFHGTFFTNTATTMAATIAFGAISPGGRASGFGPRQFRGTGFDRKTKPVTPPVVFLSHGLDHSLSRIKRIQSHDILFVSSVILASDHWQSLNFYFGLTRL